MRAEQAVLARLGGAAVGAVLHEVDQHRQPERVRQQDELLALVVALVPGGGQEPDAGQPLLLGQPHLSREGVEAADQRPHDLAEARVRAV
jgi:hypothetical protein